MTRNDYRLRQPQVVYIKDRKAIAELPENSLLLLIDHDATPLERDAYLLSVANVGPWRRQHPPVYLPDRPLAQATAEQMDAMLQSLVDQGHAVSLAYPTRLEPSFRMLSALQWRGQYRHTATFSELYEALDLLNVGIPKALDTVHDMPLTLGTGMNVFERSVADWGIHTTVRKPGLTTVTVSDTVLTVSLHLAPPSCAHLDIQVDRETHRVRAVTGHISQLFTS